VLHPALFAVGLLCLAVPATAQTDTTRPSPAAMREMVVRWNADWARARLARDTAALERMLPSGYTAKFGEATMSRAEFMETVKSPPPEITLSRFEPLVLTVQGDSAGYTAVIQEKLEFTRRADDGTMDRRSALWVIKDRWERVGGSWQLVLGEVVGNETWRGGTRPPFRDW
jgi:hypothetical protein